MMSGSRALEFLASQGCTTLGNLVLSRRDALLADVRSTVPAEEVARLRYSPMPQSAAIFPHALLDSALLRCALLPVTLLCSAPSIRPGFLGSLRRLVRPVSPRLLARVRPAPLVLPRLRSSQLLRLPPVSLARERRRARARLPFPRPPEAPAAREVKEKGPGRSQPDGVTLPMRVGGCLSPHWRRWQEIGAETWVVTVLRDGYHVPFKDFPPPLARTPVSFPMYRAGSPRAQALRQEVEAMLAKGALEIARDPGPGFYSRLFLVEKATGGWRPVIDLSHLNDFVQLTPFKMETVASVLLSVREGDFLASLDLKDAYFQIPIHGSSRKLLRFMSEGTVYQFKALCFGLSTAPQVFTRVFAAVSAWAHARGIRLLRYLDDWLVLSSSEKKAKESIRELLSLCHTLGIVINEKKSDLVPSQSAKYLGITIDTGAGKVFPSLARVEKFLAVAERFCTMQSPPAQLWQVILGHLASLERLVPHGRLRMRSLQWHLKTQWSPEPDPPSLPVALPEEARRDLSWWMVRDHLLTGVRFGTPAPDLHLYSDASSSGWGATPGSTLLGQAASATPLQPVPPRRPRAEPSRVATLKRHYRKSSFSGRAARVLSGVLRESSSRLYQSRWKIFCGWCRGRSVAPVNASVPVVVDFLIHLHQDKGLSVSAVKGYCSALNSVLALKGRDLAASREIATLLRSFARSVNPVELRPPAWDVSLVLQSLTGAPYEPLRTCEERFLAQKTLFLLALASAKRIGELHALSYRVSHTRDWGEVSFAFVTGFVAKTQDPSSLAPRFEGFSVPALPNARKNRNGRLLCPVRAVKVYLDRTAPHRPRCERLFVTAGRSKKEIAKTTVSFWLRKTISRAYELSGTALPVPAPRARETRGIAPSILFRKNFAVDQVLKAGTWRKHTTFTCHYLRDIAHKSLDTFHLGPVVAAQSVV